MYIKSLVILLGLVLLGAVSESRAQTFSVTSYTDPALFAAAAPGATTYNFSGLAPDTSFTAFSSGVTVGPAFFSGSPAFFAIGPNAGFGTYGVPILNAGTGGAFTTAELGTVLSAPVFAIAFDVGSFDDTNKALEILVAVSGFNTLIPISPLDLPGTTSTPEFIGLVSGNSNTKITGLLFEEQSGRGFDLTDFSVAATANISGAVPEPTTWAMMILGFCGLGFLAHRRKQNASLLRVA